jgi:very-short-patch-repair endonuclease
LRLKQNDRFPHEHMEYPTLKLHPKTDPLILSRSRELRINQTPAETHLWMGLRNRQLGGYKFRRQAVIGGLIVDFLCCDAKLIIEVDGDTHVGREYYDAERTALLEAQGFLVIRFTNKDVSEALEAVLEEILNTCKTLTPQVRCAA